MPERTATVICDELQGGAFIDGLLNIHGIRSAPARSGCGIGLSQHNLYKAIIRGDTHELLICSYSSVRSVDTQLVSRFFATIFRP